MDEKHRGRYRSERVKLLVANFHQEFVNGHSISEIEEKYHVSKGYAYGLLDEIAQANGVSKEMYYQMEHGPHIIIDKNGRLVPNKNVSFIEIRKDLSTASDALDDVSNHLDVIRKTIEEELQKI